MNIGPTARGTWDQRALDALAVYGSWMALHSDSIYGCTQSEYTAPPDCRLTQNGNKLYVHVFAWPFKYILVEGIADNVGYAQLLHDGSEVLMNNIPEWQARDLNIPENTLVLELPVKQPNVVVPVIELILK